MSSEVETAFALSFFAARDSFTSVGMAQLIYGKI
jgi:hypothetical protein